VSRHPRQVEIAIVVGSTNYGDADRIIRLLTPQFGRISALARRARGDKKRFGGALGLGNRIEAGLRRGGGSLWILDEATLQDGRVHAHTDLHRLNLMVYACEICGSLAREEHPEPRLFGLLDMACTVLHAATHAPRDTFRLALEAKALTFAGLTPALLRCLACEEPLSPPLVFHPHAGGTIHSNCSPGGGLAVQPDWLEAVEQARRTPLQDQVDASVPPGPNWALAEAIENHLGRALRSRAALGGENPTSGHRAKIHQPR
jgi:DNA repair protein RecO (recombination protein O)